MELRVAPRSAETLAVRRGVGTRILAGWSVGSRLALALALVIAGAAFALVQWLDHERDRLFEQRERTEVQALQQLALTLVAPLEFDDDVAVAETVARMTELPELAYLVIRDVDRDEPVARLAPDDLRAPVLHPSGVLRDASHLWLSAPITDERGATLGTVEVGFSLVQLERELARQRDLILLACAGFGALVLLGLVIATRVMLLLPLRRLTTAAEAIGRGELVDVVDASDDEVGQLVVAFNGMAQAIVEREQRLERANYEVARMLDGMRQAIFTFGADLHISGRHSRASAGVFRRDIDGAHVHDVLLAGLRESSPEYHAMEAFLSVVFEVAPAAWAELRELAPREIHLHEGTEHARELVIEFIPLLQDDRLDKVMVLATDETEARRTQREIAALRDQHAAELGAMRRMLSIGVQVYVEFERSCATRFARIDALLAVEHHGAPQIGELLRLVHAMRGGARTLGLLELEAALAEGESALAPAWDGARTDTQVPCDWAGDLAESLLVARDALLRTRDRMIEASPLGPGVFDQVTVSARDLERLVEVGQHAGAAMRGCIDRLWARPFAEVVSGLDDTVQFWAVGQGKRARLEVEGGSARIDRQLIDPLRTAVTQLVRNAIAHGIEPPSARTAMRKPAIGLLRISCVERDGLHTIEVSDDGGGVDVAYLRARAQQLGIDAPDAELPFIEGLTSRAEADALSGRGVGMGAVRHELRAAGYDVELVRTDGEGTCFRVGRCAPSLRASA